MANKRITSRFDLNIHGIIHLYIENKIEDAEIPIQNKEISEEIEVLNISYSGIQVVFSNNEFFNTLFNIEKEYEIQIEFEFQKRNYKFKVSKKWERIYDFAEHDFYIALGFTFDKSEYQKESLVDILLILYFQNIYF